MTASIELNTSDKLLSFHEGADEPSSLCLLNVYRQLYEKFSAKNDYINASRIAEQCLSLSADISDVYRVANAHHNAGNYHRALEFLNARKVSLLNRSFRYLTAKSYVALKLWDKAFDTLGEEELDKQAADDFGMEKLESSLFFLRGTIYEAHSNIKEAKRCYQEALCSDIYNYEAFYRLVSSHMLTQKEEQTFLQNLPWDSVSAWEREALHLQYSTLCARYCFAPDVPDAAHIKRLNKHVDVRVNRAYTHYNRLNFKKAYRITSKALQFDPLHERGLLLHVGCLIELKKTNELFIKVHYLVDRLPDKAITWYSLGCYYYLLGHQEKARRYFSRALGMGACRGESWIAAGHSFASEGDHDAAMTAYRAAARVVSGSHLPSLYTGVQYVHYFIYESAQLSFEASRQLYSKDPLVFHEIGVAYYKDYEFEKAIHYFREASSLIEKPPFQETSCYEFLHTTLLNIGHSYRKLQLFEEAKFLTCCQPQL